MRCLRRGGNKNTRSARRLHGKYGAMIRALGLGIPFTLLLACGEAPPPPAAAPASSAEETTTKATVSVTPSTAQPTEEAQSPEEKKKAEERKALMGDRAAWEKKQSAELARWTPELHAQTKALAEKSYPTGRAAIQAVMLGKHRAEASAARDKWRHPLETLEFFGFKPTMTVLDIGPGEGWYTELLAPALAKQGHYVATNGDPHGDPEMRSTFYAQRFVSFLERSPEGYGKTELLTVNPKAPKLDRENAFDMVLIMRGVHGMVNGKSWGTWLDEIQKALKPNGVLGIEEHRARSDADPEASSKKGYVPEKYIIETVQQHGFKLAAKSEVNANTKDTKDYPDGVWTLPPTYAAGETNRDKFAAIGESDRTTLKFVKVVAKGEVLPKGAR